MHIQELGDSIVTNILEAFEIFPEYTFLWKLDLKNDLIRLPNNVVIRKWFPQNDILGISFDFLSLSNCIYFVT